MISDLSPRVTASATAINKVSLTLARDESDLILEALFSECNLVVEARFDRLTYGDLSQVIAALRDYAFQVPCPGVCCGGDEPTHTPPTYPLALVLADRLDI